MGFPLKMKYKTEVYHREVLSNDLSVRYVDNVLCGIASGDVKVMSMGFPSPFGTEFTFYYPDWQNKAPVAKGQPGFEEYLLALALSANNGWGTSYDKCFTYLSGGSEDKDYIEPEGL